MPWIRPHWRAGQLLLSDPQTQANQQFMPPYAGDGKRSAVKIAGDPLLLPQKR
jgi:hypothetical protein